jgi:hypothetical protein
MVVVVVPEFVPSISQNSDLEEAAAPAQQQQKAIATTCQTHEVKERRHSSQMGFEIRP